ncbi:hypothetical protein GN244_ATG04695, partial [Phytophthora infestans]
MFSWSQWSTIFLLLVSLLLSSLSLLRALTVRKVTGSVVDHSTDSTSGSMDTPTQALSASGSSLSADVDDMD